jgi:RNA polymerase sigma factor (sigma-70 family)
MTGSFQDDVCLLERAAAVLIPTSRQAAPKRRHEGCPSASPTEEEQSVMTTTSLMDRRAALRGERSTDELVRAAAAGERQAWDGLVQRYGVLIRSVVRAHRLCDADADDVAQVTWLRAIEHVGRLQDPDRFGAWLRTVTRHECLRVLRASARQVPTSQDELGEPEPEPVDADRPSPERRAAVRSALTALPPRQRALLRLLHSEPTPSYDTIGSALGMPVGSIGPTRARALERLRRQVDLSSAA